MPQSGEQNQRSGHERSGSHVTRRYELFANAPEHVFADHKVFFFLPKISCKYLKLLGALCDSAIFIIVGGQRSGQRGFV